MSEYNLERFVKAQKSSYSVALSEIRAGQKQSHWMWYIFPQIRGLGMSSMADYYGIQDLQEAEAYLKNPMLKHNLVEISEALLELPTDSANEVFGYPDNMKLKSSMTLFAIISGEDSVFHKVLDKFFGGAFDTKTIELAGVPKCTDEDPFVDFVKEKCAQIPEDKKKARFEKLRAFIDGDEGDWE